MNEARISEPCVANRSLTGTRFSEPHHVDGVLGLKLKLVELFGADQNVLALGVLVAFDDFVLGNLLEASVGLRPFR
jgi:hypothetical protein